MPQKFVIPMPTPGPYTHGPDSQRQPEVPQGTIERIEWRSTIFPGTLREYWIYVPAQYVPDRPANVMVFQDGASYLDEKGDSRAPAVFDNLIHTGRMPVTIGIFINPGYFPPVAADKEPISNRSLEYDSLGSDYARFLMDEILPAVAGRYRLTDDPDSRAICGASSGGICAFTVAWERPDAFRKVLSHVGSFADWRGGYIYPNLIRKTPPKPIRVYLQAGSNDLDNRAGNWPLANLDMAAALNFAGYDYHLEYGDGAHDMKHAGAILPQSLIWLWR
jgi:enterochelin esterase-like enzyme